MARKTTTSTKKAVTTQARKSATPKQPTRKASQVRVAKSPKKLSQIEAAVQVLSDCTSLVFMGH